MEDNRALIIAIGGIIIMSLITPVVLSPITGMSYAPAQNYGNYLTGGVVSHRTTTSAPQIATSKTKPMYPESCTDSDGGFIFETAGAVSGYKADGYYYNYADYCLSSGNLVEYYCYNKQPFFGEVSCSNDSSVTPTYSCHNGACI
jgi:hypothetical protein